MNCIFYGYSMYQAHYNNQPPFVLFKTNGNQCALITTSHAPCRMEMAGETPDWQTCILVREVRMEDVT
jgi:hypothetical protein